MKWSEAARWSPGSFHEVGWSWPPEIIRPLSTALRRRQEPVDRATHSLDSLTFGSLHFDGELSRRDMSSTLEVKGKLFFAHADDVVYSKIDARNGAIGIVPETMPRVAFSSEYPIYEVNAAIALPEYVKLLFRMSSFRERINSLISGASGRKRVEPSTLESIEVPLPPLAIQRAIVAQWQAAQAKIAITAKATEEQEATIRRNFLEALGLSDRIQGITQRAFSLRWAEIERWDLESAKNRHTSRTSHLFPCIPIRELILPLKETTARLTPANTPEQWFNYIGMENVEAITGRLVGFTPVKGNKIKSSCVVFDHAHILYGKLRPYLRKIVVPANEGVAEGVASSEFISIKPRDNINTLFLAECLRSCFVADQAKQAIGARMPRVSPEMFLGFTIPLPPLAIQCQLVAEITAAREQIAAERATAAKLATDTAREVEEMILGIRPISA